MDSFLSEKIEKKMTIKMSEKLFPSVWQLMAVPPYTKGCQKRLKVQNKDDDVEYIVGLARGILHGAKRKTAHQSENIIK